MSLSNRISNRQASILDRFPTVDAQILCLLQKLSVGTHVHPCKRSVQVAYFIKYCGVSRNLNAELSDLVVSECTNEKVVRQKGFCACSHDAKPISSWQPCPCPADSALAAFAVIFAGVPAGTHMAWAAAVCYSFVWMLADGVKKCSALFSSVRPDKPLVLAHYLPGAPVVSLHVTWCSNSVFLSSFLLNKCVPTQGFVESYFT